MRKRIFFIVALLLTSATALAQNINIPNLSADEVIIRLAQSENLLVVDARTEEEYRAGHILKAVNIPPEQFTSIGKNLPPDKSLPIIFYCRGYS